MSDRVAALRIQVCGAGVIEHDAEPVAQEQAGVAPPECGAGTAPFPLLHGSGRGRYGPLQAMYIYCSVCMVPQHF